MGARMVKLRDETTVTYPLDFDQKLAGLVAALAPGLLEHEREDIAGEVRLRLIGHSLRKFNPSRRVKLTTFLVCCARNAIRDQLRQRRQNPAKLPEEISGSSIEDNRIEGLAAHICKMGHALLTGRTAELLKLSHQNPHWSDARLRRSMGLTARGLSDLRYRARAAVRKLAEAEL